MFRKLILTGFAVFVTQGALLQLVLSLVFSLAYSLLIMRQALFHTQEDNRYAELCNMLFPLCWE